jgi:hypothetical protein
MQLLNWWLSCVPMDPQTGMPTGPPAAEHWPGGEGYWAQPAPLVDAVNEMRSEWPHLQRGPKPKRAESKPSGAPPRKRRH